MSNKEFTGFINSILKLHGFSRKGNYWYSYSDEIAKVVNAQKSSFSNLYYLNYGFQIKVLQNEEPDLHYFTGLGSSDDKI